MEIIQFIQTQWIYLTWISDLFTCLILGPWCRRLCWEYSSSDWWLNWQKEIWLVNRICMNLYFLSMEGLIWSDVPKHGLKSDKKPCALSTFWFEWPWWFLMILIFEYKCTCLTFYVFKKKDQTQTHTKKNTIKIGSTHTHTHTHTKKKSSRYQDHWRILLTALLMFLCSVKKRSRQRDIPWPMWLPS